MTIQELEKMGIVYLDSKLHPKRFFVPNLGDLDIDLNEDIKTIFIDIVTKVYERGHVHGIEKGKEIKIQEIKTTLNI